MPCQVRLSYLTLMRTLRHSTSLLLSLLLCAQVPAQTPSPLNGATVHPDLKRAQKAAERGDKAVAAGRVDEALAAYEEAARYAPQDASIVERSAALRSKLVRAYAEAADRSRKHDCSGTPRSTRGHGGLATRKAGGQNLWLAATAAATRKAQPECAWRHEDGIRTDGRPFRRQSGLRPGRRCQKRAAAR